MKTKERKCINTPASKPSFMQAFICFLKLGKNKTLSLQPRESSPSGLGLFNTFKWFKVMAFTEESFLTFIQDELGATAADFHSLDFEFRQFKSWSSLNALFLISRLADETGVFLSSSDLAACKTFRDIFIVVQPIS